MGLADLIRYQLKRVNAYRGLVVDVPTWTDAHDYHRNQFRFHNLALHRPGIIAGLDITPFDPPDRSIIIHPGAALDADGNVLIIADRQRYQVTSEKAGRVFITARFREIPTDFVPGGNGGQDQPSRILEGYLIEERLDLPERFHVELARTQFDPKVGPIVESADPDRSKANEIDLRFRVTAGVRPLGEVRVGLARHGGPGWDRHEAGLRRLIAGLNAGSLYAASYAGPVSLTESLEGVGMVYFTGAGTFELPAAERQNLGGFLAAGGTVVGDACHEAGAAAARAFADAFDQVARSVARKPAAAGRGHPLLASPCAFAVPPQGGEAAGVILEHEGTVYLAGDYGCAWEGWQGKTALPRSTIRDAHDLGLNVMAYAAERARLRMGRGTAQKER